MNNNINYKERRDSEMFMKLDIKSEKYDYIIHNVINEIILEMSLENIKIKHINRRQYESSVDHVTQLFIV